MNNFDVKISNYQRLSDVSLSFKNGLNIITGESNNGKTAILRAIRSAIYNIPNEEHIQEGKNKASVSISYNNTNILWERDKSKSSQVSYTVNGVLYQKIGRNALPEVTEALGISKMEVDDIPINLNFQSQMEYPFLLDKSSAQLYKLFTQTGNKFDYTSIISKMREDAQVIKDDYSSEVKYRDKLHKEYLDRNALLKSILPYNTYADAIIELESEVCNFNRLDSTTTTLIDSIKKEGVVNKSLSKVEYILLKLGDAQKVLVERLNMLSKLISYQNSCSSLTILKDKISKIDKLDGLLLELDKSVSYNSNIISILNSFIKLSKIQCDLECKITTIDSIKFDYNSHKPFLQLKRFVELYKEYCSYSDEINLCESEINKYESEINKIGVCPYCGQIIPVK